jgi:hypothetical protein
MKRLANAMFCSADIEAILLADWRFAPRGRRHTMMPAEGVWRIDRSLIHRSAWKWNSTKSEPYGANSRASKATRKAVILPSSTCSQLATATGEATVVCMSYQVSTS